MNHTEKVILRKLAGDYFLLSRQARFLENRSLHRAVNDLKPIRPVVLIDELPWTEMAIGDELTMRCEDPVLRQVEWFLRSTIYKARHLPADMILTPYVPVYKKINVTGIGVSVNERTLAQEGRDTIRSHEYHDQLATDADLDKLRPFVVTYDQEETLRRFQLVGDAIGDILPVRLKGVEYASFATWDDVSMYRGVNNLLLDLADRPEFMHRLVRKLHDIKWDAIKQTEALGLFDNDPHSLHCTPILASDLPGKDFDGEHVTLKNVWGRAVAQIFASVSGAMHEEFDINYVKEPLSHCGLVYYGCCEPLDRKMDIVQKIPNLRKVSITPWADVNVAAEAIGRKYVLSSKPNPASVATDRLDHAQLRKEIGAILKACQRNGCACDLVLKDISTCNGRPQNIFEWESIVMEMVKNS
ncbi:MAG: hypothetical protein WCL16_02195 [bacterium]